MPHWPLLFLFALLARAADKPSVSLSPAPEQAPSYTDTNSVEALRNLRKIDTKDPAKLSEAELVEWVRARFAWIALLRLQGKEKDALEVFAQSRRWCEKHGPSGEWRALKSWGCKRDSGLGPCH